MIELVCKRCEGTYHKRWKSELKRAKYCGRKCQTDALRVLAHARSRQIATQNRPSITQSNAEPYRYIPLSGISTAIVDTEDYDGIAGVLWYLHTQGYACNKTKSHGVRLMHRIVLARKLGRALNRGEVVDHINHDKLDCRRSNLRLASVSQNGMNMTRPAHNVSGYKGVWWSTQKRKWKATIKLNGYDSHIGFYDDPEQAALAYDVAATQLFGNYALTNIL